MNNFCIGGIGGSGTRVIAEIFTRLGYFMGNDLNESNDNLLFTLIFKRTNILVASEEELQQYWNIFYKLMATSEVLSPYEYNLLIHLAEEDRELHKKEWLQTRVDNIKKRKEVSDKWGWKEPNTHIVIEKLLYKVDSLKFIYVYRNGLDMTFSENQNQLKLWGPIFLNDYNLEINPRNSLKYWCIIQRKMIELQKRFQGSIYLLDFDALCVNTKQELLSLAKFIGCQYNKIVTLEHLINPPSSIGRHKQYTLDYFDMKDINFVDKFYTKKKDFID